MQTALREVPLNVRSPTKSSSNNKQQTANRQSAAANRGVNACQEVFQKENASKEQWEFLVPGLVCDNVKVIVEYLSQGNDIDAYLPSQTQMESLIDAMRYEKHWIELVITRTAGKKSIW